MQRHSLGAKRSSTRQSKAEKRASGCRSQLVQAVSTCSSPAPRQGANRAKTRFTMAASWASNNAALLALKPSPALLEAADPLVKVLQARIGYRDEASVAAAAHAVAKLACVRGTTPAQLEPFIKNAARAAILRMGQIVTLEDPIFEANHVFLVDGKLSCHLIVGKMEYPSASDRDGDQPLISLLMQGKSDEGKKPMSMERAAALALRLAEKRFGEVLAEYTTGVTLSEASTLLQSSLQRAVFVANTPSTLMLLPREELNTLLDEAMAKSSREHDEAMTWLSKAPSFEGCGTWLVGQMIKNSVRRTFAFGEEVTREGAHSNDLLLVCAGEVVLTTTAKPTHRVMSAGATSPRSLLRELPLRHLGPLQLIPCLPVHAELQEGVHFACSARVISAHATLLLLDCRYLGGVLQRSGERAERAERAGAPTLQHQRSSLSGRSHARRSIAPPPATERKEVWPDVAASLRVDAARIARLIEEAQENASHAASSQGRPMTPLSSEGSWRSVVSLPAAPPIAMVATATSRRPRSVEGPWTRSANLSRAASLCRPWPESPRADPANLEKKATEEALAASAWVDPTALDPNVTYRLELEMAKAMLLSPATQTVKTTKSAPPPAAVEEGPLVGAHDTTSQLAPPAREPSPRGGPASLSTRPAFMPLTAVRASLSPRPSPRRHGEALAAPRGDQVIASYAAASRSTLGHPCRMERAREVHPHELSVTAQAVVKAQPTLRPGVVGDTALDTSRAARPIIEEDPCNAPATEEDPCKRRNTDAYRGHVDRVRLSRSLNRQGHVSQALNRTSLLVQLLNDFDDHSQELPFNAMDTPEMKMWRPKRKQGPSPLNVRPSFAEEEKLFSLYSAKNYASKAMPTSPRGRPACNSAREHSHQARPQVRLRCHSARVLREPLRPMADAWSRAAIDNDSVAQALTIAALSEVERPMTVPTTMPSQGIQPALS